MTEPGASDPPAVSAAIRHDGDTDGIAFVHRGLPLRITARPVPRLLWMTVTIDVHVDGRAVLRSGGQLKATGSVSTKVVHSGREHELELRWGRARLRGFPVVVSVDGVAAGERVVPVTDRWMTYLVPVAVVLAALAARMW